MMEIRHILQTLATPAMTSSLPIQMAGIVNQDVIVVVAKEMSNVGNVMVEEVSDVITVMVVLLNAELAAGRMRWIVHSAMDLEKMEKALNAPDVLEQELIPAKNVAAKT